MGRLVDVGVRRSRVLLVLVDTFQVKLRVLLVEGVPLNLQIPLSLGGHETTGSEDFGRLGWVFGVDDVATTQRLNSADTGHDHDDEGADDEDDRHRSLNGGVADDGVHFVNVLGLPQRGLAVSDGPLVGHVIGPVTELRVGGEDLQPGPVNRDNGGEEHRYEDDEQPPRVTSPGEDHQADRQGDSCQQLVGNAEEREESVDAPQRVGDAHEQNRAPASHHDRGSQPGANLPRVVLEARPEVTQRIGEHEPGDAGASVDRGEDEQGLEHDREVVPEAHHGLATKDLVHDRR